MHGIGKRDKQQGRHMGWHKLTEIKSDLGLDSNWLTAWDIVENDLTIVGGETVPFKILTASDDNKYVGKPYAGSYTPLSNRDFLAMIREALAGVKGAVVETVGSVCNRGRVFVSVSLKGMETFKIGDRQFNDFLNFGNSHDQSCAVWVNASNICTVCYNTFTANLEGNHEVKAKVKHSKELKARLENITELVDAYCGTQAKFKAEFERLMNEPMSEDQARNFYAGFTLRNSPTNTGVRELGPKTMAKVERMTELFTNGRGNNGDDRADCFQGGTEFFTHFSTRGNGQNTARQAFSSEFGMARNAKVRLWSAIRDPKMVTSLMTTGRQAIKDFVAA